MESSWGFTMDGEGHMDQWGWVMGASLHVLPSSTISAMRPINTHGQHVAQQPANSHTHPSSTRRRRRRITWSILERELMLSTSSFKLQVLQEWRSREHPHKPVVQVPLLGGGSWVSPAAGWCAMAKGCVGRRSQTGFWPPGFCRPGGYEAMMMSFFFFFLLLFVLLKSLPFFFQPPPPAATTSRLITTQIPQLPRNTNQPNSTQNNQWNKQTNKQNQSLFQNNFFFFWGCGEWIQLQELQ